MRGTAPRGPGSSRWTRALITGASSGIGEAIARRLAADHVELVLVARRRERLREVGEELERVSGRPVEVVAADLTEDADVLRVEARLSSSERPVDLLVNNAGGGQLSLFPGGTPEEEARSIRLNATAIVRLTAAVLPGMRERHCGTILNVSSGSGLQPSGYAAVYGASKAFVNSFSEAIREENRNCGVSVTVVCPGFTRTGLPARTGFDVAKVPRFLWMTADDVATHALAAAARGRGLSVPGFPNKLGAAVAKHAPRRLVASFVARGTRGMLNEDREREVSAPEDRGRRNHGTTSPSRRIPSRISSSESEP